MADDNSQNGGANEKLEKIEARLKQIAGYRFIPPSIKREREDLEKQKTALLTTQANQPTPQKDNEQSGQQTADAPATPFAASVQAASQTDLPPHPSSPQTGEEIPPAVDMSLPPKPVDNLQANVAGQNEKHNDFKPQASDIGQDLTSPSTDFWSDTKPQMDSRQNGQQATDLLPQSNSTTIGSGAGSQTGDGQQVPTTEPDWFKAANGGSIKEDGDEIPEMDLDSDFKKITESSNATNDQSTKPIAEDNTQPDPITDNRQQMIDTPNDLVGNDYTVPHGASITDAPEGDDAQPKEQGLLKEQDEEVAEFDLQKPKVPATLDEASKQIESLTKACRDILKAEANHEDAEYLTGVVNEFEETVNAMVEKAKGMPMRDAWKAKAVSGRLSTYVKALKADFEFSNLLRGEIEKAINVLVGE